MSSLVKQILLGRAMLHVSITAILVALLNSILKAGKFESKLASGVNSLFAVVSNKAKQSSSCPPCAPLIYIACLLVLDEAPLGFNTIHEQLLAARFLSVAPFNAEPPSFGGGMLVAGVFYILFDPLHD